MVQDTLVHAVQRLGIEGCKTFVQNEERGTLQQCAGHIETAAFAMRELPARLTQDLVNAPRHPLDELAQPELAAYRFGFLKVFATRRPATSIVKRVTAARSASSTSPAARPWSGVDRWPDRAQVGFPVEQRDDEPALVDGLRSLHEPR